LGFSKKRSLPKIASLSSVKNVYNYKQIVNDEKGYVILFFDEFTHVFEPELALLAVKVLNKLGFKVEITKNLDSGRAYFSKGELETAKKMANKNVRSLSKSVQQATALIGIEPSALLSFKDEYPQIVDFDLLDEANIISEKSFLLDEFIAKRIDDGAIDNSIFTSNPKEILIHGHCHQKAITGMANMRKTLNFPKNYSARLIPSGCCGMAGSFGYESKNEELSNKIGELVLFPTIRSTNEEVLIVASGFSCRHQIMHGTQRRAAHYIEAIWEALK
jgi:Fe-S oxidoreductase